jgi:plasmid maintenance system antidote protein VapI
MSNHQLREFLNRHKLGPGKFASAVGVTEGAVSHWLTGRRHMPATVVKLCKIYDQYPQLLPWAAQV